AISIVLDQPPYALIFRTLRKSNLALVPALLLQDIKFRQPTLRGRFFKHYRGTGHNSEIEHAPGLALGKTLAHQQSDRRKWGTPMSHQCIDCLIERHSRALRLSILPFCEKPS